MSDTSQTSAIDIKKSANTTEPVSPIGTFFGSLIFQLFHLFIIIITGACMLWSAKVAQTNLMATDFDNIPYKYSRVNSLDTEGILINVDVVKTPDAVFSTKIKFDVEENMKIIKFGILGLDSIREWTDGPKSNNFTLYLGTIWQKMSANYSSMINSFYNILNSFCSESVIIFFMPFIIFFVLLGVGVLNGFYGAFLWFSQLYLLFSVQTGCFTETQKSENSTDKYERKVWGDGDGMFSLWNFPLAIFYIFIALISVSWLGALIIFYFLIRSALSSLLMPFFMTAKINGTDKEYSFSTLLMNVLKYKISVIMYIISFFIISDSSVSLGGLGAFIAIIACLFIYSFYPNIYKQYIPTATDGVTAGLEPYNQAKKNKLNIDDLYLLKGAPKFDEKCEIKKPKSWFESIMSFFSSIITTTKKQSATPVTAPQPPTKTTTLVTPVAQLKPETQNYNGEYLRGEQRPGESLGGKKSKK